MNQPNRRKTRNSIKLIINSNFQEPTDVARRDIETIEFHLRRTSDEFDRTWQSEQSRLTGQKQRCQFNADLQSIHVQLDDLSRQLAAMRGQYGSSLAGARMTSTAFLQFEKTIQLLEMRIANFISTAHQMIKVFKFVFIQFN